MHDLPDQCKTTSSTLETSNNKRWREPCEIFNEVAIVPAVVIDTDHSGTQISFSAEECD